MMRHENDPQLDPQRLREKILKLEARVEQLERADIVIDGARLLKVRAPAGHYFAIGVSDAGVVVLTDKGISL